MGGKKVAVGLDFGATKIMAAAIDRKLNVLSRVKLRTKAENGPKETAERMAELCREAIREASLDADDLGFVGVGAPGPLNPDEGIIVTAPNLGWKNVPLRDMLEKELKVPVVVDNDVNMGTYGEYVAGAAQGKDLVVGVFPGSGIGGGLVIDGEVIHGASGAAGEVGHIIVDPSGALCGCGRRGCIETVASRIAIARDVAAAALRGQAPWTMEHIGTNINKMKSSDIADAIKNGDEVVAEIVRYAARMLGMAAADIVNILSPDCIVLGGGLVEAMRDIFVKEVARGIKDFASPAISPSVEVVAAKLGDDAVAVGAAEFARKRLKIE
jgi:glucokinase